MIQLHLFPRCNNVQISSPCAKVEAYLKLVGLPYERVESWDLDKAPKKKFPFIEDGDNIVPDSWFILRYLKNTYGDPLDSGLTESEQMWAHSLMRTLEDSLYFIISYFRWLDDEGFEITKEAVFGKLPAEERNANANGVREIAQSQLHYQGYGRHSPDELLEIATADLNAVNIALGDQQFLLGDAITSIDCSGFSNLEALQHSPVSPRLSALVRQYPTLVAYTDRMRDRLSFTQT